MERLDNCMLVFCDVFGANIVGYFGGLIRNISDSGNNLQVLSYYGEKLRNDVPEDIRLRINWNNAAELSYAGIDKIITGLGRNDVLWLFGAERLVPNISEKTAEEIDFVNLTARIHHEEDEQWELLCDKMDQWFARANRNVRGLWIFLSVTVETQEKITDYLKESSNMSILECRFEKSESINAQQYVIKELMDHNNTLEDIMNTIHSQEALLDEASKRYLMATAYKASGDVQSAIALLTNSGIEKLKNHEKILLAECCYLNGRGEDALDMLEALYVEDPYMRGLAHALLRASLNTDKKEKWIKELYKIASEDEGVMEAYASLCSQQGDYRTAAEIFRKISERRVGYYKHFYELVACMNDIIEEREESEDTIWQVLLPIVEKEPTLKNEAIYRCALYFKNMLKRSDMALCIIKRAELTLDAPKAQELVDLKAELLKDFVANQDLKCKTLIELIALNCSDELAYARWREFMGSSVDSEWKNGLYLELLCKIPQYITVEIHCEENEEQSIYIRALQLLAHNGGYVEDKLLPDEEIEQVLIRGGKIALRKTGIPEEEPWVDYYGSLLLSQRGRYQNANNHALMLFKHAAAEKDKIRKKRWGYLGLLAWGNNQFRMFREAEGVACVMAGFLLAESIREFGPFIECGVPLLTRFLLQEVDGSRNQENKIIKSFFDKFASYSQFVKDYSDLMNLDRMINDELCVLMDRNQSLDDMLQSCIKMVNSISILANHNKEKAYRLVKKYGDTVLTGISSRKDIFAQCNLLFAEILFYVGNKLDYYKSYNYIQEAIHSMEENRKVFHQEERTAISVAASKIYRFYLRFLFGLSIQKELCLPDGKAIKEELFYCVQKVLPRTLEEQNTYLNEKHVTEEEEKQFQYYLKLSEKYNILKRNSRYDETSFMDLERELMELGDKLQKHPYFAPLIESKMYTIEEVQKNLNKKEAVIQILLVDNLLIIVLISKDDSDIRFMVDDDLLAKIEKYDTFWGHTERCQSMADEITEGFFESVYGYIRQKNIKKLYLIPDFKLGYFSLAGSRYKGEYLVDLVDSLIHIVGYQVLMRRSKGKKIVKVFNKVYGEKSDPVLADICNWLEIYCNKYEYMSMGIEEKEAQFSDGKALIVYGHGLNRESVSAAQGALGIWDGEKIVYLEDIIKEAEPYGPDYFVLMSCSGGMPLGDKPEMNKGSWVQMFERLRGGIISCHWAVTSRAVCQFLSALLYYIKSEDSMDIIFIKALRETRQVYAALEEWACFEYWEN